MDERELRPAGPRNDSAADDDLPPELRALAARYAAQPAPRPTAADTARLLTRLLAEEPAAARDAPQRRGRVMPALRVARWRLRLLGPWFWVASVLLLLLSAGLTPALFRASPIAPLVLVAPLTVVLGLAQALRTSSDGLRAVEAAAPIGFVPVTAGLVLAIVAFDSAFGILASALLAVLRWAPFAALVAAWLSPLLLLAGVSLPIALRWGAIPAAVVGTAPWLLLAGGAVLDRHSAYALAFALPGDATSALAHAAIGLLGLAAMLLTLLRGGQWRSLAAPQAL